LRAVVAVVVSSQPKAFGLARARRRLVPAFVRRRKDFESDAAYSDSITRLLEAAHAHLVLMAGFLQRYVIPSRFEGRVMNIHPALIPLHCGKGLFGHHVHEAVVAAREPESGCTVHFVNEVIDGGKRIMQARVPIRPGDTEASLSARVEQGESGKVRQFMQGADDLADHVRLDDGFDFFHISLQSG